MTLIDEINTKRRAPSPALAREIRRAAGISQARLAAELGVSTVTVCRWEGGSRRPRGPMLLAYVTLLEQIREASAA